MLLDYSLTMKFMNKLLNTQENVTNRKLKKQYMLTYMVFIINLINQRNPPSNNGNLLNMN